MTDPIPTIAEPVAPVIQSPDAIPDTVVDSETAKNNKTATKKLLLWILTTTFVFVIGITLISFIIIALRGGTLPATDILSTVINVLGSLLLNLITGS